MRKLMVLAAPLMLALVPAPAAAMTSAQADCPVQAVGQDFAYELVGLILTEDRDAKKLDSMTGAVDDAAADCAEKLKIPAGSREDYVTFSRARVAFYGLSKRLGELGIPVKAIDAALDYGPGRTNPSLDDVTDEKFNQLVAGLGKAGIDTSKLGEVEWKWIGGYIGLAGEMYRLMDTIK